MSTDLGVVISQQFPVDDLDGCALDSVHDGSYEIFACVALPYECRIILTIGKDHALMLLQTDLDHRLARGFFQLLIFDAGSDLIMQGPELFRTIVAHLFQELTHDGSVERCGDPGSQDESQEDQHKDNKYGFHTVIYC